jgi:hypothetical protein
VYCVACVGELSILAAITSDKVSIHHIHHVVHMLTMYQALHAIDAMLEVVHGAAL